MKKLFKWFIPNKNTIKVWCYLLPGALTGWLLFPTVAMTYSTWIIFYTLIIILMELFEIKDKLKL